MLKCWHKTFSFLCLSKEKNPQPPWLEWNRRLWAAQQPLQPVIKWCRPFCTEAAVMPRVGDTRALGVLRLQVERTCNSPSCQWATCRTAPSSGCTQAALLPLNYSPSKLNYLGNTTVESQINAMVCSFYDPHGALCIKHCVSGSRYFTVHFF